ncbi:YchJ family protein [Nocardioides sp.]|uniref:YchJ family protein n=1 Tax=Nocardioides sp. TaxID=35761 RepID=UPI003D0F0F74
MQFSQECPCGTTLAYDACCGPLHRGTGQAGSPEQLMRARYAAYALGEFDYVFRTWHPRTRPHDVTTSPALTWTGLEVVAADDDIVEFRAHFRTPAGDDVLHERSRFELRGGRWVYVEALTSTQD